MSTGLAPVSVLNPGAPTSLSDLRGWVIWLERAVASGWRGDEWDAANWLFTGDVTNPRTAVWKCTTAACDAVMKARGQRCQPCELALRASDRSPSAFAATHIPVRQTAFPGAAAGRCAVGNDQVPCVFAALSRGLCQSHYGLWIRYQRRHPVAVLEQWAQTRARPRTAPVDGAWWRDAGRPCKADSGCAAITTANGNTTRPLTLTRQSGRGGRARSCVLISSPCCSYTRRCGGSSFMPCSSATRTAERSTRPRCARPFAHSLVYPRWSVSMRTLRWPC